MNIIKYNPTLPITNVDNLPHGLNCRYLEVIKSHVNTFIAKSWHRKIPKYDCIIIDLKPNKGGVR